MACTGPMILVPSLADFDVSESTGFLSEKEPLRRLSEYFAPWEEVAGNLPQLIVKRGLLYQTIQKLPLLDHDRLSSEDEWRRAHLLLACISHAYVWCEGESKVAKVLPRCLAVPWVAVSKHLDIPPVISHCCYMLYNWQFIDPKRPLSMENMKISVMITGSRTEEGFVKIPLQVEFDFGKGINGMISGLRSVLNGDKEGVLTALLSMKETLVQMTTSFLRIRDVCDPEEFYHKLRPFLSGWLGNPALPDGLVYEGVSLKPLQYAGGSAAESSIFQVLDVVLGVTHSNGGLFLHRMRQYMPPKHRAFIETLSVGPSFRKFVVESGDVRLLEAYNQCVEKLREFRHVHLQVVTRFIVIPANKRNRVKDAGMSIRGTGGSGVVMSFLKEIRNETGEAVCRGGNNEKHSRETSHEVNRVISTNQ